MNPQHRYSKQHQPIINYPVEQKPDGATHYVNTNFYKLGRFDFVYRYDAHRCEWVRSYLAKWNLNNRTEINANG